MIGVNRRRTMGGSGGGSLPYDKEIEYLENADNQSYIDTGILANAPLESEIEVTFTGTTNDVCVLGARTSSVRIYLLYRYNGFCIGYGNYYSAGNTISKNVKYKINTILHAGEQSLNVDNVNKISRSVSNDYALDKNLYLYCMNYTSTNYFYTKCKIHKCIIYKNGVKVRDFIPVRKGQVGYLYDKVSGELFGNSGTGDFILGPDKN